MLRQLMKLLEQYWMFLMNAAIPQTGTTMFDAMPLSKQNDKINDATAIARNHVKRPIVEKMGDKVS